MPDFTGSQIDHLNIAVPDLQRSVAFYEPVLATLGIVTTMTVTADPAADQLAMHAFGWSHKPFFWLVEQGTVGTNMHLAFQAEDRATVREFYRAALEAGGTSMREPGLQPEYHETYYGAFVFDPDGINVEAVCHRPE